MLSFHDVPHGSWIGTTMHIMHIYIYICICNEHTMHICISLYTPLPFLRLCRGIGPVQASWLIAGVPGFQGFEGSKAPGLHGSKIPRLRSWYHPRPCWEFQTFTLGTVPSISLKDALPFGQIQGMTTPLRHCGMHKGRDDVLQGQLKGGATNKELSAPWDHPKMWIEPSKMGCQKPYHPYPIWEK